jgi:hypothetical protein
MGPRELDYKHSDMVEDFMDKSSYKRDTETGIFARQLVLATIRELFVHETEATKWITGGLIPIDSSMNAGATEYSFLEQERTGLAEIVADDATDIPLANISGRNNLRDILTPAIGIKYSRQEVRTAQMQGMFDLVSSKVAAAREGHDIALNNFIRSGIAGTTLVGVVNQPGIIVANAVTGTWSGATGQQIYTDVATALDAQMDASSNIEMPNHVVMPVASYNLVNSLFLNPGFNQDKVLDALKGAYPMVSRWDWEPGMNTTSAAGGNALVAYRNDASRMRAVAPLMMAPVPPEPRGLSIILNFESRFGGVMTPRPRSVLRLDGI